MRRAVAAEAGTSRRPATPTAAGGSRAGWVLRPATARTVIYGCLVVLSYAAAYATLLAAPGPAARILAIAALAFVSVHCGFIAHEAGHGAITRDRRKAAWVGQVFNTLLTALSCSHFNDIHSRHHPHRNERSCDPDMQSSLFSMYPQAAVDNTGLGKVVSRYQAVSIWVLVWLQGFSLRWTACATCATTAPRPASTSCHAAARHVVDRAADAVHRRRRRVAHYALMTLLIGPYLGMIFLVNHIGTRVIEPGQTIRSSRSNSP